jgi:hypothetical protein
MGDLGGLHDGHRARHRNVTIKGVKCYRQMNGA